MGPEDDMLTLRPKSYFSNHLSKAQRNYFVPERELFAIVKACEFNNLYLLFNHLYSDLGPSTSHLAHKNPSARLSRWMTRLEYSLVFEYRKGSLHGSAENLSRWPQRWPRNDYNYIIIYLYNYLFGLS